jgi:Ca2+/Na+ antiporter
MHLSQKRTIAVLLVYLIPPIVFWVYAFTTSSHGYYNPLNETLAAFLTRFFGLLIGYPLILFGFQFWILFAFVILYFTVAYGLLFLLWRRKKQTKPTREVK